MSCRVTACASFGVSTSLFFFFRVTRTQNLFLEHILPSLHPPSTVILNLLNCNHFFVSYQSFFCCRFNRVLKKKKSPTFLNFVISNPRHVSFTLVLSIELNPSARLRYTQVGTALMLRLANSKILPAAQPPKTCWGSCFCTICAIQYFCEITYFHPSTPHPPLYGLRPKKDDAPCHCSKCRYAWHPPLDLDTCCSVNSLVKMETFDRNWR